MRFVTPLQYEQSRYRSSTSSRSLKSLATRMYRSPWMSMGAQISNRKWSAWIFLTIYYKQAVLSSPCKHKNARHIRRANFFAFFRDYYPQMPSPSGNKWGDVFETNSLVKKFLRFRGCIRPLSVGISVGSFWASRIKVLNRKNIFQNFCKNRVRIGFQIPNKWRHKKIFEI